jgi:hypothetical protein
MRNVQQRLLPPLGGYLLEQRVFGQWIEIRRATESHGPESQRGIYETWH